MREYIGDCQRCRICETRKHVVFGDGNPEARVVFVGDVPRLHEDQQGLPFVGKAGELLVRMVESMTLNRKDVYFCNIMKCRPPDNRNPRPDEILECSPFIEKQLQLVQPEVIVSLGNLPSKWLTGKEKDIDDLRGRWHEWKGISVMPTYHPTYLLRHPRKKAITHDDLELVMKKLGI